MLAAPCKKTTHPTRSSSLVGNLSFPICVGGNPSLADWPRVEGPVCGSMADAKEAKEEAERLWQAVSLRSAVEKGELETAKGLLDEGSNPLFQMQDGASWTILSLACWGGHHEITKQFCGKKGFPKIEAQDSKGFQALSWAVLAGSEECTQILLEKKADVNAATQEGETPLMMASAKGYTNVVRRLLEADADPDALDNNNMNALKKAACWGHTDVVSVLREKATDDPAVMKHCLLFAKLYGHDSLVNLLDPPPAEEPEALEEGGPATEEVVPQA